LERSEFNIDGQIIARNPEEDEAIFLVNFIILAKILFNKIKWVN
jgi:hypothetical protein